jgi:hypothetical protein
MCPISKHQPLRVPNGYHRRGSGATVEDNHGGPLITGEKPIFRKIIKTQTDSQIVNRIPCNHTLVTGAHGSGAPGRPIKRSASAPLRRNSASLEGHSAVPT